MKIRLLLLITTLGFLLSLSNVAIAEDSTDASGSTQPASTSEGNLVPITEKDSIWFAKAKSEYPVTTCIVSGEGLGSPSDEAFDFIYREEGKADRLISFCCDGCSKDFGHDARRFLQMLDAAAAKKK